MADRRRLKLKHTKEGLVVKLTRVVRDAAGEVIANTLEESPTLPSHSTSFRLFVRDSASAGTQVYTSVVRTRLISP